MLVGNLHFFNFSLRKQKLWENQQFMRHWVCIYSHRKESKRESKNESPNTYAHTHDARNELSREDKMNYRMIPNVDSKKNPTENHKSYKKMLIWFRHFYDKCRKWIQINQANVRWIKKRMKLVCRILDTKMYIR